MCLLCYYTVHSAPSRQRTPHQKRSLTATTHLPTSLAKGRGTARRVVEGFCSRTQQTIHRHPRRGDHRSSANAPWVIVHGRAMLAPTIPISLPAGQYHRPGRIPPHHRCRTWPQQPTASSDPLFTLQNPYCFAKKQYGKTMVFSKKCLVPKRIVGFCKLLLTRKNTCITHHFAVS